MQWLSSGLPESAGPGKNILCQKHASLSGTASFVPIQVLLFEWSHRQSSPLSNSCSLLLSHISHPYIDICISAPHRFSTKPSRGKGSTQILNLQIAVQKYPFKVRNSSKYRLRHSCTKTNIFCQCRCVSGAFVEFATPRVTQNIVILLYYSTLHIQMQLNQQRNGRKSMFLSTYVNFLRRIPLT